MKKIYLSAAALLACSLLNAQSAFTWDVTSYKGAFPVTDNTTATDWTSGWANWDPENTNYAAPTSTLSGDVTTNTSISGVVYLNGFVHVTNNAVLTIAPGTVIRCKMTDASLTPGTLIITRGAKIMAQGTASQPIVFTSIQSVATGRNPGDWGGIIICGNGLINTGGISTNPNVSKIEGFVTVDSKRYYGGSNDADNSGVLSYVRIEFAGVALDPLQSNSEINGLTLGAVGSGTQIDHVQVSFSGDDSFEWFGGTVDAKHLIAYRGTDDDFDTDFGYRGRVQFGLGVKDPDIWDVISGGQSNGFECDNTGTSPYLALPLTKAVFSNMTMIGAKGDGTVYGAGTLPTGEQHEHALHLRRNMAQSVMNSIFVGQEKGLRYQGSVTQDNLNAPSTADSVAFFGGNILTSGIASTYITESATVFTQAWYHTFATANNVDTITTVSQVNFVNAFTALGNTPDYRLSAASTASNGASFNGPAFVGGFTGLSEVSKLIANSFVVYPNPATQNTNISFNISEKNDITVNVYDVLGNLVCSLNQNSSFEKGSHTINLNTANFSSGIYTISLEVNGLKETKKLIISH
ncbi:MAG: T9SS type A sorting domain-containing protein [Bacteroidota bacterium]